MGKYEEAYRASLENPQDFWAKAARNLLVSLIITASCGIEVNRIIDYKEILDSAIKQSSHKECSSIMAATTEVCQYNSIS